MGFGAQKRYFRARSGSAGRAADLAEAERCFGAALEGLAADDPLRAEVSFALGSLRITDHESRCGYPCSAPAELTPIVELLAALGGQQEAAIRYLYPYALSTEKLYRHSRNPADIDRAISSLRRAADHPQGATAERRLALIALADQYFERGQALKEAGQGSGPGSGSWAAFSESIRLFTEVLTGLTGRGWRRDPTRKEERIAAQVGLIRAYDQRWGDASIPDDDLKIVVRLGRDATAAMPPDHWLRPLGLGLFGVFLLLSIVRRLDGLWESAVNQKIARPSPREGAPLLRALDFPGATADLRAIIDALSQAAELEPATSFRQPLYVICLAAARLLRYVLRGDSTDISEVSRLMPVVIGNPGVKPSYRRQCAEFLAMALLRSLHSADLPLEFFSCQTGSRTSLAPSADADLDMLITLFRRFVTDEDPNFSPELSSAFAVLVAVRDDTDLTSAELAASYARQRAALAAFARAPAMQAILLYTAAATGAALVRRDVAEPGLAAEVAAMFRQAARQLPARHPMASYISAQAGRFAQEQSGQPPRPARPYGRER
jgi:hypothetical protein